MDAFRCVTGYSHRIHTTVRRSLYRSGPRDRLFRYILNFDLKREAMKKLAALTLSLFLTSGIAFADSPKDADAAAAATKNAPSGKTKESDKSNSAIAAEIEELRQTLQSQQEQLQLLKEQLAKRDRQIDEAREAAAAANSHANEANVKASEAVTTSNAARSASAAISSNAADPIVTQQAHDPKDPKSKPTEDGPGSIRYKGVTLTPGGFIAAETVFRTRATSADIKIGRA